MRERWTEADLARLRERFKARTHVCEDEQAQRVPRRVKKILGPIDLFVMRLEDHGIASPTRELVFQPGRKWRFDLAWPAHMVAVE